ncbi:MAG: HAD-IIA family hydrolase [Solirubrobacterales bacterium]
MALADDFDGFLIDLDGVVWEGREMIPGAVVTLRELLDAGKEIVFVTNNPGKLASAYTERLQGAGIPVADDRVVTAGEATAGLAAEHAGPGGRAFTIGAPAFHETVAAAGLEAVPTPELSRDGPGEVEADVVIVSGHRDFGYAELLTAARALQGGAKLFATSRDPTVPMPGGAWPGTGAVLAAVETASGATAMIGGKPESHLFELAQQRLRCSFPPDNREKEQRSGLGRLAMVGDRVSSDIEGGRRAGLATILVLSGATTRAEAERASPPPDHVVADLAALLA